MRQRSTWDRVANAVGMFIWYGTVAIGALFLAFVVGLMYLR